jgi:CRISPR-associated protein Csd1
MILQALYELAQAEGLMDDPDFERKPVAWLVRVGQGGKLLGIEGTHQVPATEGDGKRKKPPKPVAKRFLVPRESARTSGDRAMFLFDKAEYVFGIDPMGERPAAKLAERFELFREGVGKCLEATRDEGVEAVQQFLEGVVSGRQAVALPKDCAPNDLFAFIYAPDQDRLVTQRAAVRRYWSTLRAGSAAGGGGQSRCLVSGDWCLPVDKHPPVKRVPGGTTSGVALVSFNASAFESYGWNGSENATVSRDASEACSTALNRLLDPAPQASDGRSLPRLHLQLSSDTVVSYWAPRSASGDMLACLGALLEANPDQVGEVYRSIWRGKPPAIKDPSAFYALTLSGAQGRAIVRDWFESTVGEVVDHLARHFADLDIVRNTPKPKDHDLPPHIPLRAMLRSLAPQGKDDAIPDNLAAAVVESALSGTPYPLSLMQRALERTRAEIGKTEWSDMERRDARAALIKAVLNRRKRFNVETTSHYQEVKSAMDATHTSPGYVLGRLMAVLERAQQEALGSPNASVVDRFFSGASATPKAVFVRLMKNARHHVRKAKDDPEKGGIVFRLERLIDELSDRFDPKNNGFPAHLDLEQQGLFVLGYHQMRKWLWMTKDERADWEKANSAAPRAYLWNAAKQEVVAQ